jgi:hypothetical protein
MSTRAALLASLALVWSLFGTSSSAQEELPRKSLEDKSSGGSRSTTTRRDAADQADGRVYSPAQLSIAQGFANWMQASYLPTGALGDVSRSAMKS